MLKEMKEKEADDIYLTTSAVLIKDNLYKINEFIKISAELGVDAVQIIPLMVLTKEHRELYVDWSGEQAQSVFDDAKSYAEDNKIFLHFFKNFENASIGSIDICSQPWTTLYIDQNGDSYPCCFTKKSLGNVKTTNLEEVWNGEIAQSFRSNVAQRNTSFEGCINCPSMGGKGYKYIL
jgi:radical SAM protein with 4Fe4S-binding SPASM domain